MKCEAQADSCPFILETIPRLLIDCDFLCIILPDSCPDGLKCCPNSSTGPCVFDCVTPISKLHDNKSYVVTKHCNYTYCLATYRSW